MTTHRPIAHAAQHPDGSWREPHDLAAYLPGDIELRLADAATTRATSTQLVEAGPDVSFFNPQWHHGQPDVVSGGLYVIPESPASNVRITDRRRSRHERVMKQVTRQGLLNGLTF